MKKITVIILTLLFITTGCSTKQGETSELVYMRDITGSMQDQQIQKIEVNSFYDLDENIWNGGLFRYINISDVSLNYTSEVAIKPDNEWIANELKRKNEVKTFYAGISKIITDTTSIKAGKNNSSVYNSIARELNRLRQSHSQRKVIVINSDLIEHTNLLSFYKQKTIQSLKSNPDSIAEFLNTQVLLEKLEGIKVYLIYQPKDMIDDERYKIISDFYKKMLESKGAKVEISANLVNIEY
jgi:hypothetical protein